MVERGVFEKAVAYGDDIFALPVVDLESAVDHDMSVLFKKVYEEEYGTFGGHPYSLLIGDYQFGRHPQDLALLERISKVAAAAHALKGDQKKPAKPHKPVLPTTSYSVIRTY